MLFPIMARLERASAHERILSELTCFSLRGLAGCVALAAALLHDASAAPAKPKPVVAGKAAVPSVTPARTGDPVLGKEKAENERCFECHGATGQGDGHGGGTETRFAKLAGQRVDYLVKQVDDFRSGKRKHDVMRIMTQHLEPADIQDISAYYAAQPRMKGEHPTTSEAGRKLFQQGDPARQIMACATCHGANGEGTPAMPVVPLLAGQDGKYLEQQLRDWRGNYRANSLDGLMSAATKPLTDADMRAIADFLSSQH